jgi:hypothetical protein
MTRERRIWMSLAIFAALLASRLCYLKIVWTEEAYPAAAAIQMLQGKALYRDVWYDKPPLSAAAYLLWGAHNGLVLRLAGAVFLWLACLVVWKFAEQMWGAREGLAAAWMLAFFFIFDIPASTLVLGPDLLMVLPHCLAVWLAWRGKAFASGLAAGVAFLCNTKGVFVLAACLAFCPQALAALLAGFLAPNLLELAWLWPQGALAAYWQQVWQWGFVYARETPLAHPALEGIVRTLNWSGFHLALVAGACVYFQRERADRRRAIALAIWTALSFAAVAGGWRFFPRYYFQLLPVAVMLGARGYSHLGRYRAALLLLLLVPLIRFGPRYVMLAGDLIHDREPQWSDLRMSEDASHAAAAIERLSKTGDTLMVWGYRPEIFSRTRMPAGTRFLDSQPLTGVIADRHLTSSEISFPELANVNRQALVHAFPTFIVDGLGSYNSGLAITTYPDLKDWFSHYREVARTSGSIVYRRER